MGFLQKQSGELSASRGGLQSDLRIVNPYTHRKLLYQLMYTLMCTEVPFIFSMTDSIQLHSYFGQHLFFLIPFSERVSYIHNTICHILHYIHGFRQPSQ